MSRIRAVVLTAALLALAAAPAQAAGKAARAHDERAPTAADDLRPLARAEHALVELEPGHGAAALLRRNGGRLISPAQRLWVVPGRAAARLVPDLVLSGQLRSAQPDLMLTIRDARLRAPEPMAQHEWWRAAIRADTVEPPATPGRPVTIVDTGLDTTHPEFAGRPATASLNVQQLAEGAGGDAHGTAVASVVGAAVNGVGIAGVYPAALVQAWDAGGDSNGSGPSLIPLSRVIEGIVVAAGTAAA